MCIVLWDVTKTPNLKGCFCSLVSINGLHGEVREWYILKFHNVYILHQIPHHYYILHHLSPCLHTTSNSYLKSEKWYSSSISVSRMKFAESDIVIQKSFCFFTFKAEQYWLFVLCGCMGNSKAFSLFLFESAAPWRGTNKLLCISNDRGVEKHALCVQSVSIAAIRHKKGQLLSRRVSRQCSSNCRQHLKTIIHFFFSTI